MDSRKAAREQRSLKRAIESDQTRQHGRNAGRQSRSPLPWIVLGVFVVIASALALIVSSGNSANGRVTATQQSYDFGQVSIHGGPITTRFPLTVENEALVTELSSS